MDVKVVITSEEIKRGLKHYRRIARQDLLRAAETDNPEAFKRHAEARRSVYASLTEAAESMSPDEVAREALRAYEALPFVTGSDDDEHTEIKGRENALENFFLMIGLEPKIRREVRSRRSSAKRQAGAAEASRQASGSEASA
jgi:hypothetical protein